MEDFSVIPDVHVNASLSVNVCAAMYSLASMRACACVCVSVCVCESVCLFAFACACTCMCVCDRVRGRELVGVLDRVRVRARACVRAHAMYIGACMRTWAFACVCMGPRV